MIQLSQYARYKTRKMKLKHVRGALQDRLYWLRKKPKHTAKDLEQIEQTKMFLNIAKINCVI